MDLRDLAIIVVILLIVFIGVFYVKIPVTETETYTVEECKTDIPDSYLDAAGRVIEAAIDKDLERTYKTCTPVTKTRTVETKKTLFQIIA